MKEFLLIKVFYMRIKSRRDMILCWGWLNLWEGSIRFKNYLILYLSKMFNG